MDDPWGVSDIIGTLDRFSDQAQTAKEKLLSFETETTALRDQNARLRAENAAFRERTENLDDRTKPDAQLLEGVAQLWHDRCLVQGTKLQEQRRELWELATKVKADGRPVSMLADLHNEGRSQMPCASPKVY